MKQIIRVLKQLRHNTSQKLNRKTKEYEFCYTVERAEKEIKKIVLGWIGEGEVQFLSKGRMQRQIGWCEGRTELRAEIRKKVE